jgi:hypothetical protein
MGRVKTQLTSENAPALFVRTRVIFFCCGQRSKHITLLHSLLSAESS